VEFYKIAQETKRLRKEQKLTQKEMADKVGITRQTLSKLEQGSIDKVSLQVFLKVLDVLGYELEISKRQPFYYFDANNL
jgi:transcriptional regulator with XRE-family HTH domain